MNARPRSCNTLPLLALLAIGGLSAPAAAAEMKAVDRFALSFGGFGNSLSLDGRVNDAEVEGTRLDFAREFEFDRRRNLKLGEFSFRPWERHEFGVRAYRDSRQRSANLDEEVRFAGQTFVVDAEVTGRVGLQTLEFDYTWWFHSEPRTAVGIQLGLLRVSASLSLRGTVEVDDIGEANGQASVSDSFYVPLAGIAARQVFGERWRGFVEARYLRRNYRDIKGRAISGTAGLEFAVTDRWSIVAQYANTQVDVEQDEIDLSGELEVGFTGPQLLARLRF